MKRIASIATFLSLIVLLCGCGGGKGPDQPELGTVSGTVTVDGKPATNLTVTFLPVDGGRPSTGATDSSGAYTLIYNANSKGAKIGKHNVRLGVQPDPNADPNAMVNTDHILPPKIAAIQKTVDVTAGANRIDLNYP